MPKLSISEAAYLLGVSTDTLRRWEKEGKITSSRTEGGHRRYDLTSILKDKEDCLTIKDIGSGVNYKKNRTRNAHSHSQWRKAICD